MITFGTLLDDYIELTKDRSASNTAKGIKKINMLHKQLTASEEYWWLEKTSTFNTVANQGTYYLPKDFRKMKMVRHSYGGQNGRSWIVKEIPDPSQFNSYFFQTQAQTSNVPTYYHIQGNQLLFFPLSGSSSEVVTILYLPRVLEMTMLDYNDGYVSSLSNGSTTVTGTGTTWLNPVCAKAGSYLIIEDIPYLISSIASDTSLTISQPYQGTTISSDTPYIIGDLPLIPEDFSQILSIGAARDYFLNKEDQNAYTMYNDRYIELEGRLKTSTRNKTTENVIQLRKALIRDTYIRQRIIP